MKITDKQYRKIAKLMLKKGYTPETAYPALEAAKFTVKVKDKTFTKIYANRVLAIMHEQSSSGEALEL